MKQLKTSTLTKRLLALLIIPAIVVGITAMIACKAISVYTGVSFGHYFNSDLNLLGLFIGYLFVIIKMVDELFNN